MGKSVVLNTEYWKNAFDLSISPVYGNEVYIDITAAPQNQNVRLAIEKPLIGGVTANTFIKSKHDGSYSYSVINVKEYDYVKIRSTATKFCIGYVTTAYVTNASSAFAENALVGYPDNTKHCQLYVEPDTERTFDVHGASYLYITQIYQRINIAPLFLVLGKNS